MARIMKSYGINVTILSGIYYQPEFFSNFIGRYNGIKYYMPSIYVKPNFRLKHYYYKFIHILKVINLLIHLKKKWEKVHFIFDDNSTPSPILFILQWFGIIELIFNIEEWPLSHNIPFQRKMISHLFVIMAFKLCRKSVCVSSYLIKKAKYYNKTAKIFKLPALTQYTDLNNEENTTSAVSELGTKFLYCGNLGYSEVIWTIIKAYENTCLLNPHEKIELVLILHGDPLIMQKFYKYIKKSNNSIRLLSYLTELEMFTQFAQASVLLAPLRCTLQDEARFPQKIAEYVATARPIITTNIGDISLYFDSNESAIFLNDFSAEEIAKKMGFVIENKETLRIIGIKGNKVGRKHFDYTKYVSSFGEFIIS